MPSLLRAGIVLKWGEFPVDLTIIWNFPKVKELLKYKPCTWCNKYMKFMYLKCRLKQFQS